MKQFQVFINILLFCILGLSCSNKQQIISESNSLQNNFTRVVLPAYPDSIELLAAQEFNKYFDLILGSDDAQIEFHIGHSTELDPQELQYFKKGNQIFIEGGTSLSTLYAVYEFLERELGCHFLTPDFEIIPSLESFPDSEIEYHHNPDITTRTVHSRLFYEHPNFALKHKVTDLAFPRYVPTARVHTFHKFMPAQNFFEEHPEYYALRNGKRRTTQLCLTNDKVFEIVLDSVKHFLQKHPEADVISVSSDDNTQYCQCANCEAIHSKEESAAGSMIHFVNKIARAIPHKQISTLAYQYTRKAPKHIVPERNVLITLCSIECDRSASIEDKCADFSKDLKEWGAISDNIRIWDYTTQFTNFLAPFPNLHTLQPNIKHFRDNNAKWIFEQHSRNPSELFELRSYVAANLLWNPDASFDSLQNVFCSHYYGDAGQYVERYIDKIHDEIKQDSSFFLFLYGDPSQGFNSFLSKENLMAYTTLFDEAEKAVKDDPIRLNHIKTARLSIDYANLEYKKKSLRKQLLDPTNSIHTDLEKFNEVTEKNNITVMNEMRYSVAEYLDQYKTTLTRAGKKNIAFNKPVSLKTKPKKYANEDPKTLTDGAYGGNSFFSNWLGFEGNHCEAIIDLGETQSISSISSGFLQVTNHIVFFPLDVEYLGSKDGVNFESITLIPSKKVLHKSSKINDIQYFTHSGAQTELRYLKIKANNINAAPDWHNASGLPAWIFIDEVEMY